MQILKRQKNQEKNLLEERKDEFYSSVVMINTFLVKLQFKNAGIFKKRFDEKGDFVNTDRIFRCRSVDAVIKKGKNQGESKKSFDRSRQKNEWLDPQIDTIHYRYIANILRILMGKRPISAYRTYAAQNIIANNDPQDAKIVDLAKNSFVRIDSYIDLDKKSFIYETISTRKAVGDAWNKTCKYITWGKIKDLLSDKQFDDLKQLIIQVLNINNPTESLAESILEQLSKANDPRVKLFAQTVPKPIGYHLLRAEKFRSNAALPQSGSLRVKCSVTKGVELITYLDGQIIIPVDNDTKEIIKNGGGFATLFDGGIVTIKELIDLRKSSLELETSDFKAVGT